MLEEGGSYSNSLLPLNFGIVAAAKHEASEPSDGIVTYWFDSKFGREGGAWLGTKAS